MATIDDIIAERDLEESRVNIKNNLKAMNVREERGESITSRGNIRHYYNVRLILDPVGMGVMLNREEAVDAGIGYGNLARGVRRESYDSVSKYNLALAANKTPEMSVDEATSLLYGDLVMGEGTLGQELISNLAQRGRLAQFISDYARNEVIKEVGTATSLYSDARKAEKGDPRYIREARNLRKQRKGLNVKISESKSRSEGDRPADYNAWVSETTQIRKKLKDLDGKISDSRIAGVDRSKELYGQRLDHLKRVLAYATIADQAEKVENMMYGAIGVTPRVSPSS